MNLLPAACCLLPARCSLLAIDSATSVLSIAVCRGKDIYYKEAGSNIRQSECAMLLIEDVINEAGLKPQDLNGVICTKGPGSFTGLRIGYSIAKGLALSLNIPFIAVPALAEIKKEGGGYYYFRSGRLEKRGFARELLEIGKTMDFNDNKALFSGPEY